MDKRLSISKEDLEKLSIEEIADLKVEVEDLIIRLDNIIENAEQILNS